MPSRGTETPKQPSVFSLLRPYKGMIALLLGCSIIVSALSLVIPTLMARGIDGYSASGSLQHSIIVVFLSAVIATFIFTYGQSIFQTYASEQVARDLRTKLALAISKQTTSFIDEVTPSKLLTNITSDVDSIKLFVSQALVSIISSVFIIIGASVLLIVTNWKLGLLVILMIPLIGVTFMLIFKKIGPLFLRSRENIDRLNRVINETIVGAAIVRVLNTQVIEYDKFTAANTEARDISMIILKLFASMIPIITFIANVSIVVIVLLGGKFVIAGSMTLGEFAAFQSYVAILIFPILIIGFMANMISLATASYGRIYTVLKAPVEAEVGTDTSVLIGDVELNGITISYGEKTVLKDIFFRAGHGTKTAIIGPTAAGKSQLLYVLTGLVKPASGTVVYDGKELHSYDSAHLHAQVGFVFQDSIIFNLTVRENIAFNAAVSDEDLSRAIKAAELDEFIDALPNGLETIISERGTTLSGGQKQRLMLARALAINPTVLLLDDFTARVDTATEQAILGNIAHEYPQVTLISVTQKIASVTHYDQIILLMEGEIVASGTHEELLASSPEYVQLAQSQQSTTEYELRT